MNRQLALIGGIGLGAGLMYLLDPSLGRRRRAVLRDKLAAPRRIGDRLDATAKDVCHRAQGIAAAMRSACDHAAVPDDTLAQRVRSQLGRCVSHPHAVSVTAHEGRVVLSGPVLAREVADLMACARAVPGVTAVENRLDIHREAGNVPALQGGRQRRGARIDVLRANWSPATRLLAGAAGCGLMANCVARRTPLAALLGAAGFGLFLRGLTNLELRRLLGLDGGCRAVEIQKTLTIAAPVEQVFRLWSSYENFPKVMRHLSEVRDLGDGRSSWTAIGPAGVPLQWKAVITRLVPNRLLAWRSERGSAVMNAGVIHFEPRGSGHTRVDVHLAYNPPAGALGHFAASLFGADAKTALDEDLARLKSLFEDGKTGGPRRRVTREDLLAVVGKRSALPPTSQSDGRRR